MSKATPQPFDRRGGGSRLEDALQSTYALPRRMGWRLRALVALALLGCMLVFALARWLSLQATLPVTLAVMDDGSVVVRATDAPSAQAAIGHTVLGLREVQDHRQSAALTLLSVPHADRWQIDPDARAAAQAQWRALASLQQDSAARGSALALSLEGQPDVPVQITPRGWAGLGLLFWLLCAAALMLLGVGSVVLLAAPQWRNALFALLAACQGVQLMGLAAGLTLDVFRPAHFLWLDARVPLALDLISAAALLHLTALHPRRVPAWAAWSSLGWLAAIGLWWVHTNFASVASWWCVQGGLMAMLAAAAALMTGALRRQVHPVILVMRRSVLVTLASWILLSLALWRGLPRPDMQLNLANYGVLTCYVFVASQILLTPYLSRARQVLQEFSLLAASSTMAGSLDLLFVGVFSMGGLTSMTLSLFMAFGLYLLIRRWLMTHLPGHDGISMERLFQRMYRIAREVARRPEALNDLLQALMRDLFDPLELRWVEGHVRRASLRGNGSVLLVPLPEPLVKGQPNTLVLKHSHKGQRLFTAEDARLAQRIMEQLHRAMSFDKAVEQGRSEERLRIAQDLHDDIGARLLTLMYQAPNGEIEEYIRHTIQDLKTLTRGLAAQSHGLAEAAGEWKRDIHQRLGVARCELIWHMETDTDVLLTMVQWSALTRILRELVSNAISHAKANLVDIQLTLLQDQLTLSVSDNGRGRDPARWSHGLGLGGVRKRVKQLGGSVRWVEIKPQGICCEVVVASFSGSANTHQTSGAEAGSDSQFSH